MLLLHFPSALPRLPHSSPHHEAKVEEEHDGRHEHEHRAKQELGVRVEGEERKGGGQRDGKLQQVRDDEAHQLQQAAEPNGEGLREGGGEAGGGGGRDVSVEGSSADGVIEQQQKAEEHTLAGGGQQGQQQAWQQACTCGPCASSRSNSSN